MVSEISQNLISTHEILNFLADWLIALEAGGCMQTATLASEHVIARIVEHATQVLIAYDAHSFIYED